MLNTVIYFLTYSLFMLKCDLSRERDRERGGDIGRSNEKKKGEVCLLGELYVLQCTYTLR